MDSIRIKLNESMSELQANPRIVSYFCYRYDGYPDYNRRNGIIQAASHLLDGKAQMDGEVIIQQTSPKQSQQSQQQERTKEPSKLVQNSIQPPQPLKSETHTPQAVELSQKEMDSGCTE